MRKTESQRGGGRSKPLAGRGGVAVLRPHLPLPTGEGAGAAEFLPLLSLVLAQCDLPELLLEAEYMSELLEPALLTGEGE